MKLEVMRLKTKNNMNFQPNTLYEENWSVPDELFVKNKDGGEGERGGLINFPSLKKGVGGGVIRAGGLIEDLC